MQSFLVYASWFRVEQAIQIYACAYTAAMLEVVQFGLIYTCGNVVKLNNRFERQNMYFYLYFQQKQCFNVLTRAHQLKSELFQTPRLLSKYSFIIFENYKITSNMFYIV